MAEFVTATLLKKHVYKGSATPISGGGAQHPQIFWNLLHPQIQYEKQQPNFAWCSN